LRAALALELPQDGIDVGHYLQPNLGQEVFSLLLEAVAGLGRHPLDEGQVAEEELVGGHGGVRLVARLGPESQRIWGGFYRNDENPGQGPSTVLDWDLTGQLDQGRLALAKNIGGPPSPKGYCSSAHDSVLNHRFLV
jgi:hypothetical protein